MDDNKVKSMLDYMIEQGRNLTPEQRATIADKNEAIKKMSREEKIQYILDAFEKMGIIEPAKETNS